MSDISKCSLCGMCKSNCPIFRATLKERYSPRGKIMLLKEEKITDTFYLCSMCGACERTCPSDVDMDIRKIRKELVRTGIETEANKKMMENIRKFGNPFGEVKEGEEPDDLYCC